MTLNIKLCFGIASVIIVISRFKSLRISSFRAAQSYDNTRYISVLMSIENLLGKLERQVNREMRSLHLNDLVASANHQVKNLE